ncbi:Zinc finger MYM-type protein 1-like [Oopsacas minuta]|uniref:Zinc finger MYM-type protein 1-like n=1 Tax=Oopsacas minuta TaxID=111878 RepID=A0AAV7JE24_9METZ|nr:Zinc finger MYM-type protein 1-like [Oopsacas minuta]
MVQDACKEPYTVKALDLLRAVMNFVKDSPKREASFASLPRLEEHSGSVGLRPLCSTRWVCREPALKSFVHNYERLMKWFAELTTAGCVSDKRVALEYLNSLRKFQNYLSILLRQKIFTTVHWTHLAIRKPNLSVTKCTEKIGDLLAILKAECTAKAGASLYHSRVQESRPAENGGFGILQPEVPRGWRGSCSVDNVREFQPQFQQNPLLNVLKIEEYFVGLYVSTFESIIESIEGRYKISPIAISIEKYLAATNETELEECGESITTIAAHVGSNTLQPKMEMKQFVVMR